MKNNYEKKIVAFIDILGFKYIVENTNKAFSIIEIIGNIKKSKKEMIREISEEEIEITWFSDCIVISAPQSIYYLQLLLQILQEIQCELIQVGILLRGGISMGDCFHKNEKLFGPAMNRAYELESKIAIVPRIVLSKELIDYINKCGLEDEKSQDSKYNYDLEFYHEDDINDITERYVDDETTSSVIYRELIVKDSDNYFHVNYIDEIISMCTNNTTYEKEILTNHDGEVHDTSYEALRSYYYELFSDMIVPLQELIKGNLIGNNMNVILKYEWLKNYYNSRLERYKSQISADFKEDIYPKMFI